MTKYVAFLRGINVGGHRLVKMTEVARLFASLGLDNVRTYIASGNVLFETAEPDAAAVTRRIEEGLSLALGFEVIVIVRTIERIAELVGLDPFKNVEVKENVRLYVTFLAEQSKSGLKLPYESPQGEFRVLQKTDREVYSVLLLSPTARSTDGMAFIEKEFGKASTTRNWNTIKKIAAL